MPRVLCARNLVLADSHQQVIYGRLAVFGCDDEPSEHQRRLLFATATFPSGWRLRAWLRRPALQQQAVNAHEPINPLGIDGSDTSALPLTAQHTPNATIAVARQGSDSPPNLFDRAGVTRLPRGTSVLPVSRPRKPLGSSALHCRRPTPTTAEEAWMTVGPRKLPFT